MQTQRLNLKVLELAKELEWPFYQNLVFPPGLEKVIGHYNKLFVENLPVPTISHPVMRIHAKIMPQLDKRRSTCLHFSLNLVEGYNDACFL